ncbi:MAG: aminotransferase class I/II-fold pyridoxal phosphate-dependent enzyme [Candidatus Omnitrophica bacterium]|nr:aminotransferase class I/II-fold pyridoxal phosphate-dependent enzyme [Candidatus Omnitrophota bacterium]
MKVPSINDAILDIPIVYTKELTESIKDEKTVVNLARGDSEFQTPKPVIDYLTGILPDPGSGPADFNSSVGKWTHYEKGKGSKRLREAAARKYERESGLSVDPGCVLVTQGGMNAIFTAFITVTKPGDEILIPDPCYVAYDPISNYLLSGRRGKRIRLKEENNFILTVDQLDKARTNKTKALILTSPLNPTGSLYDAASLKKITAWCIRHNIFMIHDENHEKEIYDGNKHYPAMLYDKGREHTILLNSFSRLGMGGWRLGWIVAPKRIMKALELAHSYINMTCNTFVQEAGVFTLDNYDTLGYDAIFMNYRKKRDLLVPALNALPGFRCLMPKATCYAFPNIRDFFNNNKRPILDTDTVMLKRRIRENPGRKDAYGRELKLCRESVSFAVHKFLLFKAGVGVIPGLAYGPGSDDYIRFSFSVKREAIEEAIQRLKGMINSL